ncbi:LysR family transcriptional regulator [Paraferrimonas sedimenticola]|uniref:LysR family transcriptional regulator n=1 Tax=Paraferrimonas sedimenticola TaxID=375674 RepID=A0AA37VZC2_9GAMM|nr:LysR family transcriptional regulator [Paraferrimonas sedimenticola]GLP97104.1 LysR family transcriptional regulator [Paraferrimonas sedimenticola]
MAYSMEQLQAFVAIVEQGGIRQAARTLNKHASTVREQLTGFEIDTNLELFIRHPKSLELTEQGRDLYQFAKAVLRESLHLEQRVESLGQGTPARLTIAIDTGLRQARLNQIMAELLDAFPGIDLKVLNGDTQQVQAWVLSGEADVALCFSTIHLADKLSSVRGFSFEVTRVVASDFDCADTVSIHDLRGWRQITFTFFRESGLELADVTSHQVIECNNAEQIIGLIKQGVGYAHLPKFRCLDAIESGELKTVSLANEKPWYYFTDILWLEERPMDAASRMFIQKVQTLDNC